MESTNQIFKEESQIQEAAIAKRIELENKTKSGANWFYWIAALSIINSVITLANGEWSFIFGLGVTQVVDVISLGITEEAPEMKIIATALALGINLITVLACALFGYLANKRKPWAFWTGMVLYGIDGIIFLIAADFFSFGFHLFALWLIYGGLRAVKELNLSAPVRTGDGPG